MMEVAVGRNNRTAVKVESTPWRLLPPSPEKCQECAVQHDPKQPHNAQSMFYQVKFNMQHHRAPTWLDAMAHCDAETQAHWKRELAARGVKGLT